MPTVDKYVKRKQGMDAEGGGSDLSEDAFRASLVSLAMFEESLLKPFIDIGLPRPPTPAYVLLSALKAEEEKEEIIEEEEVKKLMLRPRFG